MNNKEESNEFEQDVMMGEQQVIEAFNDYKEQYQDVNECTVEDDFDISENAVKGSKRIFKSVLKLDKNFHVYIHGDRKRILKGIDKASGMNFYQLFYEEEK